MSKSSFLLSRSPVKSRERFLSALHKKCPEYLHSFTEEEALSHLCLYLARVPETLDLAAAHAAQYGFNQLYALFKPYLETQPQSEEALQDLVYATFLEALPRPLHTFLCQMALFRDGWTAEIAATMFSIPCADEWCAELLALDLLTKDLLTKRGEGETARYSISPALHDYLKKTTSEASRAHWKQVFLAFYLDLARAATPHLQYIAPLLWMDRLNAEAENLYCAIDMSRGAESVELVCCLWRWALERGDWDRMYNNVVMARACCPSLPRHLEAETYRAMGVLLGRKGGSYQAAHYLRRGLKIVEERGETRQVPFFLNHLGVVLRKMGEIDEAERMHQRAYAIWCEQNNLLGQGIAVIGLGILYWGQDRLQEAHQAFAQGAQIACFLRDDMLAARTLDNMALVAEARGDYEAAAQGFSQSLPHYQKFGLVRDQIVTLNNLGVVWYRLEKYRQARANYCKVFEIAYRHDLFKDMYSLLAGMAQIEVKSKNENRAVILYSAYHANIALYNLVPDNRFLDEIDKDFANLRKHYRPSTFAKLLETGPTADNGAD